MRGVVGSWMKNFFGDASAAILAILDPFGQINAARAPFLGQAECTTGPTFWILDFIAFIFREIFLIPLSFRTSADVPTIFCMTTALLIILRTLISHTEHVKWLSGRPQGWGGHHWLTYGCFEYASYIQNITCVNQKHTKNIRYKSLITKHFLYDKTYTKCLLYDVSAGFTHTKKKM